MISHNVDNMLLPASEASSATPVSKISVSSSPKKSSCWSNPASELNVVSSEKVGSVKSSSSSLKVVVEVLSKPSVSPTVLENTEESPSIVGDDDATPSSIDGSFCPSTSASMLVCGSIGTPAAPPGAPSTPPPLAPIPGTGMMGPNPPPAGTRLAISAIMRSGGMLCSQQRPGPVSVVTNSPSPPNITFFTPGIICTSYDTVGSNETIEPDVTRSSSPSSRYRSTSVPPALIKTSPSPTSRCKIKPCPPKKPPVIVRVNSICMSTEALLARYAPRCATKLPP
mmetsp:Transcript_23990/g.51008  ORF Transcript_23990/g.51008 Transcript_23990/m.51008 type:complete len:282 (+) Transcript_23990:68-913(+)